MKRLALMAVLASLMGTPAVAQSSKDAAAQDSVQLIPCEWKKGGLAFMNVEPATIKKDTPQFFEVSTDDYLISTQMIDRDGLDPDQLKETMSLMASSIGIKKPSDIDEINDLQGISGHIMEGDMGDNGVYLITLAPDNATTAYLMIIVYVDGMEEDIDKIIDSIHLIK